LITYCFLLDIWLYLRYFIYKVVYISTTIVSHPNQKWKSDKGGKFVFGLSVVNEELTIHIPPQALSEYHATRDWRVIIFTGSKITGGFCVTGGFIQYKGRKYAWLGIGSNGVIKLPQRTLEILELKSGMELLSIRSSDIAFTMGAKGPLLEKARSFRGDIEGDCEMKSIITSKLFNSILLKLPSRKIVVAHLQRICYNTLDCGKRELTETTEMYI